MIRRLVFNTIAVDIQKSLNFYKKLGFELIEIESFHYAYDRSVVVRISSNTADRRGLSLINERWGKESIESNSNLFSISSGERQLFSDSTGTHIYLETRSINIPLVENKSILGNFAGVSIEAIDFNGSINAWEALGFKIDSGGIDNGWVSMSADGFDTVSIMKAGSCPHIFSNPGLTYFNGEKNIDIIKGIRKSGLSIAEEITVFNPEGDVDNIILQDPGGLTFFIFND